MSPNRSTKALLDITTSSLLAGTAHGFLGRAGGASEGIYAGLNIGLGSDDDREAIIENRRRAKDGVLPGSELVTVYQIHSAEVVTITGPQPLDQRPQADAMVTDQPNFLLGILTADCVPVLFHDPEAKVIGAAHAGWKGAIAGVTDNVLITMEKLGASRDHIACAIGPCIAQPSYEVDAAFRTRFLDADAANDRFFAPGEPGHFQFDIEDYVAARLQAAGMTKIDKLGLDTYALEKRYFSYRRSCHRGEAGYGRQMSLIGMAE
ncbi:MAG: peptidoglycan editing factor PgeF [Sphingomonadales bacterium]|nr:peptidoglycan editing factor PgeF [Sphingomonadales bacterium]PIX66178.1 MAG: peptidoglycan editing factor PgeF [Sphingomonadales bacterium CG_4_10_14_3_um_filter_58_15]NCO50343.1 peptidoglycan editing factor PgeF [Sphingomonadales bacterium]NCP00969.1 peptidoglycan editing factor PgeF [Sphingomonadales bacterium]NCP28098.1 peptidoglycan editing factor PgeF [Sphingomonadales bacterium]